MPSESNLDRLKAAYRTWHDSKGASTDTWLDLLSDTVHVRSMHEETPGLSFAKDRFSKQQMVDYFSSLLNDWTMDHFSPEDYVCEDNRIAVYGHCAWFYKANGNKAECLFSHLWRFEDGKVVEFTEVFDSAKAAAAASG